jgi:Gnt-I system high-affinity gluconate transporter
MPLVIVAIGVALLLLLMVKFKLNGFISLIIVAILVGLGEGMPLDKILASLSDGIGGQLDKLVMVLGFGAMLGLVLADSGAAQRIAGTMLKTFGIKHVQLAIILAAIALGITMFYEVAFVLLIPLAFTIVRQTRLKLLWIALPLSITLSTMHSFLPPHPGPVAVAGTFHASVGLTLLYGLCIAIPVGALIALAWPRLPFIKEMDPQIPAGLVSERTFEDHDMPTFGTSLFVAMFPVILIAGGAIATLTIPKGNSALTVIDFIGAPPIALLVSLMLAIWLVGLRVGRSMDELMKSCAGAVKSIAMILVVIGGGGAFKQVLVDSGINDYILHMTSGWAVSPIILAWGIAVIMRIALGSATVAVVAAAGIALPLVTAGTVAPEVMVLAVTCGSIAFSHVNDPGFWLYKEFLGLSVLDAIKTRTTYTSVLSILGLGGVLLLNTVVG